VKTLIRSAVLAIALMAAPYFIKAQEGPQDFQQTLSKATLSVYRGKQVCEWKAVDTFFGPMKYWGCNFKRSFTCTGTVIGRLSETEYIGLSAGHCIDWKDEKNYYVGSTVEAEPVLHSVQIVKSENDDRYDYVVFVFHSVRELPVIKVNTKGGIPPIGTKVMSVNFALGVGKQYTHGEVNSEPLDEARVEMKQRYLITNGAAPGASGSAIVSEETHEIVGLCEFIFPGTQMGTGVIPTGKRYVDFLDDDSAGLKPTPAPIEPTSTTQESLFWKIIKEIFSIIKRK
jgi:trypsin-like peptidase